ncbi:hypothetical protein [Ferrovibrio terrae]
MGIVKGRRHHAILIGVLVALFGAPVVVLLLGLVSRLAPSLLLMGGN